MTSKEFREMLADFVEEFDPILQKFEEFLKKKDLDIAREISSLLIRLGISFQRSFKEHSHSVLTASMYEAGLRISERTNLMKIRGIRGEDIEYFEDIYNIFKHIADTIKAGEYEESFHKMVKRRSRDRRKREQ